MMDLTSVLGYLSGLYFIRPEIEPSTLIRTATVIHLLDALLCRIIAGQAGRNKNLWMVAGLVFGIWALGPLFLLVEMRSDAQGRPET